MLDVIALASLGGLLAVWLLYPLVMAGLSALGRPRVAVAARGDLPTVTVVIATRDDAAAVRERVDDCLRADYQRGHLDVVVALDCGGGVTPLDLDFAGRPVTVVAGDAPGGKAATLNAGVRAARGEVLAFADAHQRFEPHAIRRLIAAFGDPRVGAASGRLELPGGRTRRSLAERYWMYERWLRRCEARVHSSVGVTGAICALRRSLWAALPPGLILDDLYTPMRVVLAGHRVAFVDDARAVETRRPEASQEYRRKVRTLTGVIQLCAWLPAVLLPFRNPIWVQFLFHKLLRLLTPYWMLAIAVAIGVAAAGWVQEHPAVALWLAVAGGAAAFWARARVAAIVREGLLMQAALVVSAVNGCRGRWDVWSR